MNTILQTFEKLLKAGRERLEYFVQGAIIEFTESVVARMAELNLSKSELAERLQCAPPYITKVLRGGTNFTLESMVKIAVALDSELSIGLTPKLAGEKWSDILQNKPIKIVKRPAFDWVTAKQEMIEIKPRFKTEIDPLNHEFPVAA